VKRRGAVVATVLALAVVAAPVATTAPRSDAAAVAALINRQTALFNARKWQTLWLTYTPTFRSSCPYTQWAASTRKLRAQTGPVSPTNIVVRVSGRRALANYVIRAGGKVVARPRGDVYVKLGGRWLDQEAC
jgi:hypothetical protein